MKILKEAKKEILPVDFVAGFISRSWEEVASLKSSIAGIKQTFSGTKDIESILEELLDAYLITIGQLQQILENKDIVIPEANKKLKEELEKNAKYAVFGHEEGEQGTKHLQGFVIWNGNRRPASLKKINEKIHWENAFGTSQQASDYCKKDGKDIFEIGILPDDIKERNKKNGNANKAKWDLYKKLAIEGKFDDIPSNIYIKNMRNLHLLHDMSFKDKSMEEFGNKDLKDHFLWLWGGTGTGKSTNARRIAKKIESDREPYLKGLNKWWNGYKCQRVTIIEEANPKACEHLAHFFKQWADKWSFPAEIKCSAFDSIRPEYIIVTSNYSIRECFPAEQDYEPLERRFTEIELTQSPLASFTEVQWPENIVEKKSSGTSIPEKISEKEGPGTGPSEPLGNTDSIAVPQTS